MPEDQNAEPQYEYKKLSEVTEAQLNAMQAQGWEYVGQVKKKSGEDTGLMRFRRPYVDSRPSESDVVLKPQDVIQRSNARKA